MLAAGGCLQVAVCVAVGPLGPGTWEWVVYLINEMEPAVIERLADLLEWVDRPTPQNCAFRIRA